MRNEGEYSQRHLKESRAGKETGGLNMANKMDQAMRGNWEGGRRGGPRERGKRQGG